MNPRVKKNKTDDGYQLNRYGAKQKKQILLINPSYYRLDEKLVKMRKGILPPLTPFYLASFVPDTYNVTVIDEIVQEIDFAMAVDLVGITVTTVNALRAYEIADSFRSSGTIVVLGGIHTSAVPDEAMEHADAIAVGEADDTWPQIISDWERGVLKRKYEGIKREDLSRLPHPRYDLVASNLYLNPWKSKKPIFPVQTGRGCPHNCSFCTVTKFWGAKLRYRPISDIIEEIKVSGGKYFFFNDDNFFSEPIHAQELCEALIPLKIRFICQIDTLYKNREHLFDLLAAAGCLIAFIGFERIDFSDLNSLNKKFNRPETYPKLIKSLHLKRISVYASMIVGLRGDTPESVRNAVSFLTKNKVEVSFFFPITPFPGTALFERLAAEGCLVDSQWWNHRVESGQEGLLRFPENPINEFRLFRLAMKEFYSIGSIMKRFFPLKRYKLLSLLLNIQQFVVMIRNRGVGSM